MESKSSWCGEKSFDDVEALLTRCASPGIRPGLDRIERLLSLLGNPEGKYPAVHVVGTNGKGSTCAFLASVFREAGYKTALYTSPHLESPGERLLIDGIPLNASRWMAAVETAARVLSEDSLLRKDPPSYFELVTAAAFLLAAEEQVEIAVVEAGMGGRLDATNLLPDVACSVVASVSMDHAEFLGETLEKLAGEKFAVVRKDTPACYLGDTPELIPLFEQFCAERGAEAREVSRDADVKPLTVTSDGSSFDFAAAGMSIPGVRIGMIGRYQLANASLALLALSCMKGRFAKLSESAVRRGMEEARWPGRLEIVSRNPIVVLDGGHNPDGVAKLTESVGEIWKNERIGIVYGVMRDKDYPECLRLLKGLKSSLYATSVPGMERSLPAGELAVFANSMGWKNEVPGYDDPFDAVEAASLHNDVVLVCGSLYLIGWIRPFLTGNRRA